MLDKVAREYLFEEVMFEKKLKEGETKSVMIWGGAVSQGNVSPVLTGCLGNRRSASMGSVNRAESRGKDW